jgi:DNA-directed RNA polymerase subunit beta
VDDGIVIKCLKKDPTKNEEEALKDIYRRLRPGDPPTAANARALLKRLFFDPKRYDLGRVGRYKINQKLGLKDGRARILTKEDLVAATKYLLRLKKGEGSRWTTSTISAAAASARWANCSPTSAASGLARTERLVKERMTLFDQSVEHDAAEADQSQGALGVIRDFFGRSQLSQFMDQINPLAELTHKRRLSALGPGGLSATAPASRSATCIRRTTAAFARSKRRKARTSA